MEIPIVVSFLMNSILCSVRENKDLDEAIPVKDSYYSIWTLKTYITNRTKPRKVEYHALLLIATVEALLESFALCVLVLLVLPNVSGFSALFIMNGLCIFPVVCTLLPGMFLL